MDKTLKTFLKVLTVSVIVLMCCYLVNFGFRLFVQIEAIKLLDGEIDALKILFENMPKF